ncbi:MAG: DUF1016 N-terminal domain-containing protein, partial [Acidobacteriota bacterium]|nr:DUF1016 N-terminal domain-containing protein [Acidobacteriota bacterium]
MTKKSLIGSDYTTFLSEVKNRIQLARITAGRAVSSELVLLYWDIGSSIVEKQERLGWGKSVVERLSADLQREFPGMTGFSPRNLWEMRRFFEAYRSPAFLQQAVAEMRPVRSRRSIKQQPVAELYGEKMRQLVGEIPGGQHQFILNKV